MRMTAAASADAELKKWLQTKAEGQDPKMALALMRDLFGLDTRKLLKEAKVPVRCINSAGGYKFFTPTAVETNKKYADFGAVTIDGVGHHPMLEKPDEFNRKLRDVLKELRPRSEPASPGTGPGRRTGGTEKGGTCGTHPQGAPESSARFQEVDQSATLGRVPSWSLTTRPVH